MGGAERRWVSCFEGEVDGSRVRMKQTMRAQRRQSKRSGRRASDVESGEMDGEWFGDNEREQRDKGLSGVGRSGDVL
jgi:hypothetical protein